MIINKCCKSLQYLYAFCYELFLSSGMDVCVGSWTKSLSRMKKIKDIAFVGPLSQRRIWKDVSGAPTWVPNPIYSTQTSLSAVCFLSGTHSSIGSSPLEGKDEEKMFWLGDHEVLQLWWSLEETEI